MKKTILLLCVLCLGAALQEMKGQTATFKALFLYNFTKNIEWPSGSNGSDLVITILGDDEISTELEKIAKVKKAGNKSIKVVSARSVKDVGDSHIVFLGSSKSSLMKSLSYAHQNNPVLLVADKDGLCKQGAAISFLTVGGKLRYQISPQTIEAHNLKVTQKIISLGIKVQ
ncbi:YfiR family protein [Carboxylicivirga sp. M1479]|uniref:YfiR family protein n=1 Tax=Carboxylicivirga sp. M1479 TaxID=2594476 RepID=UPI0011785B38|nr:YfiR family protein [Carboxylicivirga sp. M1479]TRX72473.1 YfiR family protein [Carboxylicivirga sp. M1479]